MGDVFLLVFAGSVIYHVILAALVVRRVAWRGIEGPA